MHSSFAGTLPVLRRRRRWRIGERGTHGYDPNLDALQATFIAWGYGIKPGVKIPLMRNIDVAPTAATLLGIEMPHPDGQVLREILK